MFRTFVVKPGVYFESHGDFVCSFEDENEIVLCRAMDWARLPRAVSMLSSRQYQTWHHDQVVMAR